MNKKELLDKLQAKITLKLGKKVTLQEILDKSIEFAYKRLDTFISEQLQSPKLSKEKVNKIRSNTINSPLAHPKKSDDDLIYEL